MGTKQYYDALSPYYDAATQITGAWTPNAYAAKHLKKIIKIPPDAVLDLGAGTGQTVDQLYKLFPTTLITAVDFSPAMLGVLVNKYPQVKTIVSDVSDMVQIANAQWQLIAAIGVLEFIPNLPKFITQVCQRILSPQGLFAFTYEPLILDSLIQNTSQAITKAGETLGNQTFTTYRHKPSQITKCLQEVGAAVIIHEEFVAYKKAESPVIYRFICAKKLINQRVNN